MFKSFIMSEGKHILHIRILIRAAILTAVILISYVIGYQFSVLFSQPHNDISGMWCAVTAVVVFDDLPINAKTLLKDRMLGTLAGALITPVCIILTHHIMLSIGISLFIVCVFIVFFNMNGALKIACATVLIVGVTAYSFSYKEIWLFAFLRFFESLLGGMVSLLATIIIHRINTKIHDGNA
ncbi:MAG: Uncharacterized protein JWO58_2988 [Chitinophagaceae bacterium]|nr:Uncharacterized protein [Chitinophagaceae bacterium]